MSTPHVPDDVPVADAVEQSRDVVDADPDGGVDTPGEAAAPSLETPDADWQEQAVEVDLDDDERAGY
ncbi:MULTISPECIES: hypothetical protein [Mycobacteriaceae]|uniref:Uncharacterized protein n=1 Tax=Mycolicibacterium neoaurum VKM Ac-1815D TaxID=700508 RepID=V5XB00_MYCNE|nr:MULTISPECIES: hypothetical protein [Mycobacteriaceae]AHC24569.1 hypothetical protein D174_08200 [Mycolicibacterium neoaurum VKM Ac-1815D]AMO05144.1 hypothetical protein MyAD_08055 [Mycolicibacterium neoaurum]AXK76549.1 hypothetical protein DXK33_17030 [Mycolicibacterium neoaurum]KJQ49182.1 hypothetical protein TS71_16595 [Mycolicibacterium neoaurum]KUM08558.1 hypothetical protein AVZ31_11270 [Mycolicibacterium neoaurum]